jgi:ATP-binding cassette, subfamily B, bacterial
MNYLIRALAFFRPDAGRIGWAFILLVLATGANLLKPWPLAWIIDSVLGDKPLPGPVQNWVGDWEKPLLLTLFGVAILVLHAAHGALSAGQTYATIQVGLQGLARVRNQLFAWLQRLSLRFHQGANQGDLIYRASWDTYAFQTLFQQGVVTFATSILSLSLILIIMWQLNVPLTLVALATVPLLALIMNFFGRQMKKRSLEALEADSKVTSLLQQNIVALPLVLSYTREAHEQDRFTKQVFTALRKRTSQHGWEVVYLLLIALVFGLGTAAITWLGANQVMTNQLTIGELLVFLFYLAQVYEPLNQLSHIGPTLSEATAGTQRVLEILDTPEEVKENPDPRAVLHPEQPPPHPPHALIVQGSIQFDQVSFSYRPGQCVLNEISCTLPAAKSTAILGPSGAGKTTLLQFLPRFYDPVSGSVLLDGTDLRKLRLTDLRRQISLVLQEPILLPATIGENIGYGKPGATLDEIQAAAQSAHAANFIEKLPQQYETMVGEGAARLSTGEKQRINLARAFLKNAPILLLDEPTSALDAESETLVLESLIRLLRGRTTLIVAHRLSTIQQVDHILVLEQGRLTEQGSPSDLAKGKGYFARITGGKLNLQPPPF